MVSVPLGLNAYKRAYAGEPEIKLVNRYVEKNPTNLREKVSLISRPGTVLLTTAGAGRIRANYSKRGLFNGDLFIVSGTALYRYDGTNLTHITGTVQDNGFVYAGWMAGIGYEYLFISDGSKLQYYTTHAMGTLTLTLNALDGNITSQVIKIGSIYYGWSATVNPGTNPDGTSSHPYLALVGTADAANGITADSVSLANMVQLINYSGISGFTFSAVVPGPSATVSATSNDTTLVLTAIANDSSGNSIATTVASGSYLAWGGATLAGGGSNALVNVPMPNSVESPKAVSEVSSYVLVSVAATNKFYWLNPGEVTIDPLNFASKESNPDPIEDMTLVGDNVLISGAGSAENWYATGDLNAPFAPIQGRVYRRGVVEGTVVPVKDGVILIGDDNIVYQVGYQFGQTAEWGVKRISGHGIEERIRIALRELEGEPA